MENEKEVDEIFEELFGGNCPPSPGRIKDAIKAHGQSCYEKGLLAQDLAWKGTAIEKDGKRISHDKFFKSAAEIELEKELTTLKAKAEKLVEALTMIASDYAIIEHAFPLAKEALKTWNE